MKNSRQESSVSLFVKTDDEARKVLKMFCGFYGIKRRDVLMLGMLALAEFSGIDFFRSLIMNIPEEDMAFSRKFIGAAMAKIRGSGG